MRAPQQVLWDLGAAFIDAGAHEESIVVPRALEHLGRLLGACSVGVWRFDRERNTATRSAHWAAGPDDDFGETRVAPDPRAPEALRRAEDLAVLPFESVVGVELARRHGWEGRTCSLSTVDGGPSEATVLMVVARDADWGDDELGVIRMFTLLLRQFHRRLRAERELEYRHRLEDFLVGFASRLLTVSLDDIDEVVQTGLREVHELVDAQTLFLLDVVDDEHIAIPFIVASRPLPDGLDEFTIARGSALPGAGSTALRAFAAERRVLDVASVCDAAFGREFTDRFELRESPKSVALLPASVGDGALRLIAIVRSADIEWRPIEFDAVATVGSLIAQARARLDAEREAAFRLEVQRVLSTTGKAFLEAGPDDMAAAVQDAIALLGRSLGADLVVITDFTSDRRSVVVQHSWPADGALVVRPGTRIDREATSLIDELTVDEPTVSINESSGDLDPALAESSDGKWTTVVAPISGPGMSGSALTVVFVGSRAADEAIHQDVVNAMADLIGQLKVRLRAEGEVAARMEVDAALSAIADDFLRATAADADARVERALARFGTTLGLAGISVRRLEGDWLVSESAWIADGGATPTWGERIPIRPDADVADREGAKAAAYIAERWGADAELFTLPVLVGPCIAATLTILRHAGGPRLELDACRAFADMLGQLRARVLAERRDEQRIRRQQVLGECAAALAEAGPDDIGSVVDSALGRVCDLLDFAAVSLWRVDPHARRYHRTAVATGGAEPEAVHEYAWGEHPVLDEVRTTGRRVSVDGDPATGEWSRLAFARDEAHAAEGRDIDGILVAARVDAGPWDDEDLRMLESLSRTIREVETRVAAERYADSAFRAAPIGIVLRDKDLNLITCNQAFVDFVGADSVDELVGTHSSDVLDGDLDDVEFHTDGDDLVAEAAFRGRGGGRVWGQMRSSVVRGGRGEDFWLVHVEDITERRRAEQLLRFQASHDELTGLANRRQLLSELHRIADGPGSAAILLLDLDRFKIINDSLGHDRGDELLVVVADRLRLAVRPGDLVARLGGDEFAVLLPGPVTVAEATFVADRLLNLIGEPMSLGSQKIYPTASVGVAVIDDDMAVDDLLRRADTAMYRAKAQGRAQHAAFDEHLRDEVTNRMATEAGLRGALRDGELCVHYQPEVSLPDGRMLGAEALVRWQHPERGMLAAAAFIDVAEETGLVVEIGELVLVEACREAASWPGGDDAPLVRVNLAAAQIQREETVRLVRSVLAATGLAPHRLCLEITESAVMSDLHRSEEILCRLKEQGVRLAVDDFGTGFSSLAYLKRFPVDTLKIDRAFVGDLGETPEDTAFVRSIVSLADALGLEVVAEGVETEEQVAALVDLGCSRAQGYLFAKPGPAIELRAYLPPVAR